MGVTSSANGERGIFWRISAVHPPIRSWYVCLCVPGGRFVSSGQLAPLRSMATDVAVTRRGLESLARQAPPIHDCQEEVARALSELTQRLYHDLKRSLGPAEWVKARSIVRCEFQCIAATCYDLIAARLPI
jgi:hypothetical protein